MFALLLQPLVLLLVLSVAVAVWVRIAALLLLLLAVWLLRMAFLLPREAGRQALRRQLVFGSFQPGRAGWQWTDVALRVDASAAAAAVGAQGGLVIDGGGRGGGRRAA